MLPELSHCRRRVSHVAHYNFCRVHGTLRVTPVMAAVVADHIWELHELLTAI
jgi:hypothetical protein